MDIFFTGASGLIGSQLVKKLESLGHRTFQLNGNLLDFAGLKTQVHSFLNSNSEFNRNSGGSSTKKVIIHLAAMSSPPLCDADPQAAFQVNVLGTSLLIEALRQSALDLKNVHILFPSSAHVYDNPKDSQPITEDTPIKIKNVYGETKIQCESILKEFADRNAVKVTILRLFNHAHISQSKDFLISSLYHQIKQLKPNENQIKVGNLDLYRDIGTLPDLINAFELIVTSTAQSKSNFDIVNICSGKAHHLKEIALKLASYLNRPDVQFVTEASRLRGNEIKTIVGSFSKIQTLYGWTPKYTDLNYFIDDLN